jgi:hypothetical protein
MNRSAILIFLFFTIIHEGWSQTGEKNEQVPFEEKSQRINNTPRKSAASTPPMGWNSWNNFGCDLTEAEFKTQVDYLADKLKPYGYEYATIDISWYSPNVSADPRSPLYHPIYSRHDAELDAYGRFIPAKNKFPSAYDGSFKTLADYVHSKGLKFGLHIMRGIPWQAVENDLPILGTFSKARDIANPADVCLWYNATYGIDMSKPGAQEYYNSIFQLYASWGVDFVKVDDLSYPYHASEITAVRKAIENSGRKIIFSTSPGSTPTTARYHILTNADMFRISSDFWDDWSRLKEQFNLAATWAIHAVNFPGHWPDLDMIPFGKIATRSGDAGGERWTRLTKEEHYTLMSLWSIARSPLIIGNDLTQNDSFTLTLLTNKEIIEVNQKGTQQKQVSNREGFVVWESLCPNKKSKNIALFNLNEADGVMQLKFEDYGFHGKCSIRNLWTGEDLGVFERDFSIRVLHHGAQMLKLTPID